MDIDVDEDDTGSGKFRRFLVELSLSKRLAKVQSLQVKGEKLKVPIQYEKLPCFCLQCGRIFHEIKCNLVMTNNNKDQYSLWLRTKSNRKGGWTYTRAEHNDKHPVTPQSQSIESTGEDDGVIPKTNGNPILAPNNVTRGAEKSVQNFNKSFGKNTSVDFGGQK